MVAGGLHDIKTHVCRFCGTSSSDKHFIAKDPNNVWSAAICEDCVEGCAKALHTIRSRKNSR